MGQIGKTRVLLVEDGEMIRETIKMMLENSGFDVVEAASVKAALEILNTQKFDVLLTDLHMSSVGDGLTIVSAVRHLNPEAVTLILSGFPEMDKAAAAILAQADGIILKPIGRQSLVETIRQHLNKERAVVPTLSTVATILEEGAQSTIVDWLMRVDSEGHTVTVKINEQERCAHLPQLIRDLVNRLRTPLQLGTHAYASSAAVAHGVLRRQQGYTAAMMVEESRMLQVSIFQTLQNNLFRVNFSTVLESVMTIADEVDSQLAQAMSGYVSESKVDALPSFA